MFSSSVEAVGKLSTSPATSHGGGSDNVDDPENIRRHASL
jgi:hypothetical protein